MTAGLETVYSSLSFAQFGGMGNCASGLAANAFYFPMHFTSDFKAAEMTLNETIDF